MADKVITVISSTDFFNTTMDEAAVAAYLAAAQAAGYFTNDDGDLVIPWNSTSAVEIKDPE